MLALLSGLLASSAKADGGELHLKLVINNDANALRQPGVNYQGAHPALAYVPRFGLELDYALANWLEIGIGATASLPRPVVSEHVLAHGVADVSVYSSMFELAVPATLRLIWHSKGTFSYSAAVSAGVALTRWAESSVTDSPPPGQDARRYGTPPFESATWSPMVSGALGLRWRPVDWMAMEGGPYVAHTFASDDWRLGLGLNAVFIFGVGPSF